MGLIKIGGNIVFNSNDNNPKEYVTCPSVDKNILIVRGCVYRESDNSKVNDGIITHGSKIIVPEGWAMLLINNGTLEFSSEAGEYIYDSTTEPTIFYSGLGNDVNNVFDKLKSNFNIVSDQRVYYINLMEVANNKFGSSSPKDIYDEKYQLAIKMTFFGTFTYRVDNPISLIWTAIERNYNDFVTFSDLFGNDIRREINEKMHTALANILLERKIRYSDLILYSNDIPDKLNSILNNDFVNKYGVIITSVNLESVGTTDECKKMLKEKEDYNIKESYNIMNDLTISSNDSNDIINDVINLEELNTNSDDDVSQLNSTLIDIPLKKEEDHLSNDLDTESIKSSTLNFCPNCGAKVNGGNFCGNCGSKLN